jgi:hypothetical protein
VGKPTTLSCGIENKGAAQEANIIIYGSTIGNRSIDITDFDVSADLPSQAAKGAIAEFEVLNLQEIPLVLFVQSATLRGHRNGLVGIPSPFSDGASEFGQSEDQQYQDSLQHNLSFGSLTLPADT